MYLTPMTDSEAYDKACELWGDGVAWSVNGTFIIGRWVPTGEINPLDRTRTVLPSNVRAVEVMGESSYSWEDAFYR